MGMDERFWLRRANQTFGPYSAAELVGFETDRRVGANDEVRRDGEEAWLLWSELRPTLTAAVAPPRLTPPTSARDAAPAPHALPERNVALEMLIPVNRNVWAIIAPYFGLIGAFTGVVAPIGLVLGVVAWRTTKPGMAGRGRAVVAIVLSSLGLTWLAVVLFAMLR